LTLGLALLLTLQLVPRGLTEAEATAPAVPLERESLDARGGARLPSATQLALAKQQNLHVSWNEFGTPRSVFKYDGYLATGLSKDPVEAARQYLAANADLFGVTPEVLANLELQNDVKMVDSRGHSVLFRQTFGDLRPTRDGRVTVGVVDGKVAYASSSLAPTVATPAAPTVKPAAAVATALTDAGLAGGLSLVPGGTENGWTLFKVGELDQARARLTVVPNYDGSVTTAWETLVIDGTNARGYRTFVDAVTGEIFIRQNLVNDAVDNPRWKFFKAFPPLSHKDKDTRRIGCWTLEPDDPLECDFEVGGQGSPVPWDTVAAAEGGGPTFTTKGNNANTAQSSLSPLTPSDNYRPVSPTRDYIFNFSDYWYDSKCTRQPQNPDPAGTDTDSAITNLFASHNRLHDWQYKLGFTEETYNLQEYNFDKGGAAGDPQIGNAQAGSISGGYPSNLGRDNANQVPTPDGVPPVTNMYLWQPIPGSFYPPCVDGDFDMSVIGHEYTHATSNRMVAGPDDGLDGGHGGSMGESWSDLVGQEYLFENNYIPVATENPWAIGAYATGNPDTGIRDFSLDKNPLHFGDFGFDLTGAEVHADGEIWNGVNWELRKVLVKKYNRRFPAKNVKLQKKCAIGTKPVSKCPGNRRWVQLIFDSWLLMEADVTMVDARDAFLAADKMRFKSKNKKVLWKAFARRGLGAGAKAFDDSDQNPTASFKSPVQRPGALTFKAVNKKGKPVQGFFYIGKYEARVTPIAFTDPPKYPKEKVKLAAGRYKFIVQAPGYGMFRFKAKVVRGRNRKVTVKLDKNLGSINGGAAITGDGINIQNLGDDTEATNWAVTGMKPNIKGAQATIDLAGGKRMIRRIQVSAMLSPESGGRFTALRQFAIEICTASNANGKCLTETGYKRIYTSPKNAFPARRPRPVSPVLLLRKFNIPDRRATHVRFVVLNNQCTGFKGYAGEQDTDPTYTTDCQEGSANDEAVRSAELQIFSGRTKVRVRG
jgi:hypothetical protein